MNHQTLNQQMHTFLLKLHQLGQDMPQMLIYLTQVAQPKLPQNLLIPFLGQMFEKIPPFLSKIDPGKLGNLIKDPPQDAVPLRILVDLMGIQQLLQQTSVLQLLHLTNNTIPPGSIESQEAFLKKVQEQFQAWNMDTIARYHDTLSETPLHLERQHLLQLEPQIPWEILHLLIELLKLPTDELASFQSWLSKLPAQQMRVLIQLLQIESSTLLEIKRRIASSASVSLATSSSNVPLPTAASLATKRIPGAPAPVSNSSISPSPSLLISPPSPALPLSPPTLGTTSSTPASPSTPTAMVLQSATNNSIMKTMNAVMKGKKRPADDELQAIQEELELIGSGGSFSMEVEPLLLGTHQIPVSPIDLLSAPSTSGSSSLTASTSGLLGAPLEEGPYAPPPPSSSGEPQKFQIRIARQPPAKTVYQRILKPFPSVMLLAGLDNDANLFVEATLLRSDNETALPQCLDGNRIVRITNGVFASFKKLKILSTSQQQGTLFRLRFTLKRYAGTQASFEDVPNCTIISNPIEVFSHTQYLNEKQDAPPPPAITDIIPPMGPCTGGTRVVILGSNFINCSGLKVRFGDMVVPATFHEAGTLICVTPSRLRGRGAVSVTNDGLNFCETQCYFSFE